MPQDINVYNEVTYFTNAVEIRKTYDYLALLNKALNTTLISTNATIAKPELIKTIRDEQRNLQPLLYCSEANGQHFLEAIVNCVGQDFKLVACPRELDKDNCGTSDIIIVN